jgi:cytochrome c554/c'-like protein
MPSHSSVPLRLLFSAIVFIAITLPALAQTQPANSSSACLSCHRAQTIDQPLTPMGRALMLPGTNPVVKDHPKLTVRKGDYSYIVETRGDTTTYSVTDGARTISIPVRWSFGLGGQTWILEHDGELYESLVSYYPNVGGLDTTIGDERIVPHTLEEAMGRKLAAGETKACFGCHASNAVNDRKLTLETMKPGVTCEHCHAGANTHLLDAVQGEFSTAPPKLGQLSSEDLSNFCGQCHRTWEGVVRGHFHGEINVRFQPYRLANSKCFDGTDPRISCVACHDPHKNVVREDSTYDPKCLACHGSVSTTHPASTQSAPAAAQPKACPVANANCVSCHMPKVQLPGGHMTFTDHEIRIVKPGDAYPN